MAGFAIGVVIIALILLAGLAMVIAVSSRDASNAMNVENLKQQILSQGYLIRQKLNQCALDYPAGNNADSNTFDITYPAQGTNAVQSLACPGAPGGPNLWTASDGVFYPAPISGCNAWQYYNNKTKTAPYLEFQITCTAKDAITALSQAASQIGTDASLATTTLSNDTLLWQLHG